MKLIYLISSRIPTEKAYGLQIMKMCEAFAKQGVEVELVGAMRRNSIKTDPFVYYGVQKNFRFRRLPSIDLVNLLPKFGTWFFQLTFIFAAKIYLLFKNYDVLYIREDLIGLFSHDFVFETHYLQDKIRAIDLKVFQKAKKIVAITYFLKQELIRLGIPANKILTAPDGVDLKRFQILDFRFKNEIRKELELPLDKKIIMYTGHLYEWKGASTLLQTAKNFQFPISNFQTIFIFVGGTDYDLNRFRKEAAGLDNVLILGHKPYSEIPKYLAAADVLVLPNSAKEKISKYYTSPLKLFEYMAAERPIVASDLPSIREVLDEASAVFVEPDNAQSLARGIKKVLSDEELGKSISSRASAKAHQFTWDLRAAAILAFIRDTR